jgi:L-lactate dehydrogenase complex protein LldG
VAWETAVNARDAILAAVKAGRRAEPAAAGYALPAWTTDAVGQFVARARSTAADVHEIAHVDDAPEAIWSILVKKNAARSVHIPEVSEASALPWQRAPGLSVMRERPSGSDSAVSFANYGIAETGTLVFCSGERSASAWHYLPGLEFVVMRRALILPRLETVIDALAQGGAIPATVNLVTGPSRTADIEQTIERGAHGPRELCILIAG